MQEIKMPSAGQTTDEATIVAVNVKVGDTVKRGDILVEAETDKAVLPVESFAAGQVLDVLVKEGDEVTAGTVLAVIGKKNEAAGSQSNCASTPTASAAPASPGEPSVAGDEEYMPIIKGDLPVRTAVPTASPRDVRAHAAAYPAMLNAKMLAKEKHVDLTTLIPANSRFIKRQDVLAAAANTPTAVDSKLASEYEVMSMTHMRSIIGRRMQESLRDIPAWKCMVSMDMTACIALRESYQEKKGIKLSYNDILAKAIAVASRKFSLVKARYEDNEVRIYHHTNIGIAVALDGALVVPVVRKIDVKGLEQIASEYKNQIEKARSGRLGPNDMGCGSITISNLGMYDVDQFVAIVNPPESCILAVGSIQTQPVWDGAAFQPVPKMTVTGSFDHRIIDGAYGAQFLQELKLLMENPALMMY